jgi:hypothetical protein
MLALIRKKHSRDVPPEAPEEVLDEALDVEGKPVLNL